MAAPKSRYTDNLRQQHAEILKVVKEMGPLLRPAAIDAPTADRLRKLLVDLSGRVTLHLAAEDKVLYPTLSHDRDAKVAQTANRFAKEMGDIGVAFKGYLGAYPSGAVIFGARDKFCADTSGIFKVLGARIDREEHELYPLADVAHA